MNCRDSGLGFPLTLGNSLLAVLANVNHTLPDVLVGGCVNLVEVLVRLAFQLLEVLGSKAGAIVVLIVARRRRTGVAVLRTLLLVKLNRQYVRLAMVQRVKRLYQTTQISLARIKRI